MGGQSPFPILCPGAGVSGGNGLVRHARAHGVACRDVFLQQQAQASPYYRTLPNAHPAAVPSIRQTVAISCIAGKLGDLVISLHFSTGRCYI